LYESGFVGEHDGADAGTDACLVEDVADVGFSGRFADDQPFGDLCVGQSVTDEVKDLKLAVAEIG
jgi:hypothetical protein